MGSIQNRKSKIQNRMAQSKFNLKQTLQLGLVGIGTVLCLTPAVGAIQNSPNNQNNQRATLANSQRANSTLIAQEYTCPSRTGGSQFVSAETANFYVYICGSDRPNTYVGISKNRNTGGIILPLRSYNGDRFVAVNGNVRYTLTRNQLIVTQNGRVIVRERATWRW